MIDWVLTFRWIHILAATSWVGEVVTINFVLVPALAKMSAEARGAALATIFPRIFRLASVLSLIALASGGFLYYQRFHLNWSVAFNTTSGICFTVGATLATLLTLFHFFAEPRLGDMVCVAGEEPEGDVATTVMKALRFIPRVGMGVIVVIAMLMMIGARGY